MNNAITVRQSDLPNLFVLKAQCPPGKKVLTGGCNWNGQVDTLQFDESWPSPDMDAWNCAIAASGTLIPAWYNGIIATAVCADY